MPGSDRRGVLIYGGSVVGKALELLLRGTDLDVRFVEDPSEEPRIPDGVRLVMISPGMDPSLREDLIGQARGRAGSERVPILELVSDEPQEASVEGHTLLLWPCPMELLRQWIADLAPSMPGDNGCAATAACS